MKVLKKVEWEDIKIGEIFAWNGCWMILCKMDKESSFVLADDGPKHFEDFTEEDFGSLDADTYKLRLSDQRKWMTE